MLRNILRKYPLKCVSEHWSRMAFRPSSGFAQQFEVAQKRVSSLKNEPDNDVKLQLYGLFKQASIGACNTKKPGALDFVGRAKWDAWSKLGTLEKDMAQKQYVELVNQLEGVEGASQEAPAATNSQYYGLEVHSHGGVTTITLNRPDKKNALTSEMYEAITKILYEEGANEKTAFVVVRGAGDYYCSGNDLNNFMKMASMGDPATLAKTAGDLLRKYVAAYVDFPKPLVAAVNGPAVGIAVTVLGLFDVVYASDNATFHTPFSALGQTPEGCSSYIFPKLMGSAKANQLLMLNKRFTADEALKANLITEVLPAKTFHQEVDVRIQEMAALPKLSLIYAKQLTRDPEKELLHKVNTTECERLVERWQSKDCQNAIMHFFQKKSKI